MLSTNIEKLSKSQMNAYLTRIGMNADLSLKADLQDLNKIHEHHALNVPFEGLDIHIEGQKSPPDLSLEAVFEKIVLQKRGGYCYEVNKLLACALVTLGFEVYSHKAGVIWGYSAKRPPGHRMLTVKVDGQLYLADVGFGGPGQLSPLKLVVGEEQRQGSHIYRIVLDESNEFELQKKKGERWEKLYAFNHEKTYDEKSYEVHNTFVATSPESVFVKKMICTMPTSNGRVTLSDNTLKIIECENDGEKIIELQENMTMQQYLNALKKHFGISLSNSIDLSFDRHGKQSIFPIPMILPFYSAQSHPTEAGQLVQLDATKEKNIMGISSTDMVKRYCST